MKQAQPLQGRHILVTRAKEQSSKLQQELEAAGAWVIAIPAIEIVPPDLYTELDAALGDVACFDWLVFTSANAVRAVAERAQQLGIPVETLSAVYIAAIGVATADAITTLGLAVELIPPHAVAQSLAEALIPLVRGKRVLLPRARIARDLLPDALRLAGASVTIAECYQTIVPAQSVEALRAAFSSPAHSIHAVTFTSASSVYNLAALAEAAGISLAGVKKISIGPITTAALEEQGWQADAQSMQADVNHLVEACIHALE